MSKKPTRIGILFLGAFPERGGNRGSSRRVYDLAYGLADAGADVKVICPVHNSHGTLDPTSPFDVLYCGVENAKKWQARRGFWKDSVNTIITSHFDAVILYSPQIDCLPVVRRLKKQGVFVAYEQCDMLSVTDCEWWKRIYFSCGEWILPRMANLNIPISTGIEKRMTRIANKVPCHLIPGLVDPKDFVTADALKIQTKAKYLGTDHGVLLTYAGTWYRPKGLASLLMAFSKIIDEIPNCKLLITGSQSRPKWEDDAIGIANALNLGSKVLFPGMLSNEEHSLLLASSDVLVCPHLIHPFADFAFPTKVAEYAGAGKAIVSSLVGDVGKYFENGQSAILYEAGNDSELASALKRAVSDFQLRELIGVNALQVAAENFSSVKQGKLLLEKMEGLLRA